MKFTIACITLCTIPLGYANDLGEQVNIPMVEHGVLWDSTIQLEATIYKPDGDGPFPTVIFNHGSTGPGAIPEDMTINPWGLGQHLVNQDIALIVPMRRGRGKSDGSYKELYSCNPEDISKGLKYAELSIEATYDYLLNQSWFDETKLIVAGNSRGGILSLVYASHQPEKVAGVVNFSGGWVGDVCNIQGQSQNISIFENSGKSYTKPALFIYGRNDSYYADDTITKQAEAFNHSGGEADFQLYKLPQGVSGYEIFYNYGHLWAYVLNSYLAEVVGE